MAKERSDCGHPENTIKLDHRVGLRPPRDDGCILASVTYQAMPAHNERCKFKI